MVAPQVVGRVHSQSYEMAATGAFRGAAQQVTKPRPTLVRRRQIVLGFAALTAVAILVAIGSGSTAAWWVAAAMALAGAGYLALLHHVRRVAAEHEFATLLGPAELDLAGWADIRVSPGGETNAEPARSLPQGTVAEAMGVARFAIANLAGWALSPLVFALTLLAREKPRDATGQRWLATLEATQERLRDQSMRTLAISAATTASVTAAGTVAGLTGGGVASAAPLRTTSLMPTATPAGATYRVVAGDTLGSIAARFGTTVRALAAVNHISDPNLIYPGQLLIVSGGSGSAGSWGTPAGSTYTVRAGDTLGAIAARFGTSVAALAEINHIANPNVIDVGQVLAINGSGGGSGTGGGSWGAPAGSTYTVHAGDTLGSIAARFGTTIGTLAAINHIADPNIIYVGQVLTISGNGGGSAPAPAPDPAPAPAPRPAPSPPSSAGQVASEVALEQVGKPYQWAGAGPFSFDCSGLVQYAWGRAGAYLPHYSVAQYEDTVRISESQLEPGDLVFYDTGGGAQPGHVTIYVGNGEIVTADMPGTDVRVEVVDWDGTPIGFGRVR